MPFSAAIFDFDGTLVDSMPMWHDETVALLRAHGVADAERVFVETEALPTHEMCDCFHERYVPDATGPELTEELLARVRRAYATDVRMLPGCREFLDSLQGAGIPMVVASSTSLPELEAGLSAQGIRGYFQDVISTGGAIRSKEYPDVWIEALRRLGLSAPDGTGAADTAGVWVFEDSPFGLRSAREAGLGTVCLFSPHGDRDEDECRSLADIFVHGYPELSIALLDDFARPEVSDRHMTALVVDGSPQRSSARLIRSLAQSADYVIAADAGAIVLEEAGVAPDVFCGDSDSASARAASWARDTAKRDIPFPSEKYATDLSIAIDCARHEAARRSARLDLVVTCASGGRPDHALAVVGQLAGNADASPRIVEDGYECRILSPEGSPVWELPADSAGKTLSAIAVAPGTVISERGLKWELDHKALPLLGDEGVSNVVGSDDKRHGDVVRPQVTCHSGAVAVFLLK